MRLGIFSKVFGICALLIFCNGYFSAMSFAADDEVSDPATAVIEDESGENFLDADVVPDSRMNACQRFNYEYRQCVSAGCFFDGSTGMCFGRGNTGPNPPPPPPSHGPIPQYCGQFNYDQFQCNRAGCYFDYRSGVCFDGGNYPPNPSGYRVMCVAVDVGFEEHPRGHMGIGHNRHSAEQAAMGDCLRIHGRCRIRECRQSY